jgi:hypothetical protein
MRSILKTFFHHKQELENATTKNDTTTNKNNASQMFIPLSIFFSFLETSFILELSHSWPIYLFENANTSTVVFVVAIISPLLCPLCCRPPILFFQIPILRGTMRPTNHIEVNVSIVYIN